MPRDVKTRGLDPGAELEIRVAQSWFWDGYYARRGIDLQHRFGADVSTVTDLDLVAYSLDSSLRLHTFIGEAKSGRSTSTPRPLDRTLWARGLRELLQAEGAEVTTAFPASISVREFAHRLGVTIQHVDDLAAKERRLGVEDVADTGACGNTVARVVSQVGSLVKGDPEQQRAYWFLRSEVWFLEPFDALKRCLGLIRQMSTRWPHDSDRDGSTTARWIFAETLSITTLMLVQVAGHAIRMDARSFVSLAADKLSAGDVPLHAMQSLSIKIDAFVGKLLSATDLSPEVKVSAMGAFEPTPPSYLEPLLELVARLGSRAAASARLPRQMDAVIFERLVRRRNFSATVSGRLALDEDCERLIRLITVFLRGQFAIPATVERALMAPVVMSEAMKAEQINLFTGGT